MRHRPCSAETLGCPSRAQGDIINMLRELDKVERWGRDHRGYTLQGDATALVARSETRIVTSGERNWKRAVQKPYRNRGRTVWGIGRLTACGQLNVCESRNNAFAIGPSVG